MRKGLSWARGCCIFISDEGTLAYVKKRVGVQGMGSRVQGPWLFRVNLLRATAAKT